MTKRIFRSLIGISLVVCMIGMTTVLLSCIIILTTRSSTSCKARQTTFAVYVEENGVKVWRCFRRIFSG